MSTDAIAHDPDTRVMPLTRVQYDRMVEVGDFEGRHVELLEGVLVWMAPQSWPHGDAVRLLGTHITIALYQSYGRRYSVGQQGPFAATDLSEPEPDIVIVDSTKKRPGEHPRSSPLIIEVAQSSHRRDLRQKPPIYAAAGVTDYWVVDLLARETVVHRRPTSDGYSDVTSHPLDADLEVLGITINVADVIG